MVSPAATSNSAQLFTPTNDRDSTKSASTSNDVLASALRRLSVVLNNVGTILHSQGEREAALQHYQTAVQVRMESIRAASGRPLEGGSPLNLLEVTEARYQELKREEERLRRSQSMAPSITSLDMFRWNGSRLDKFDIGFLPSSSPETMDELTQCLTNLDNTRESAMILYNMGLTHLHGHSTTKAQELFGMATQLISETTSPVLEAKILNNASQAQIVLGDSSTAGASLSKALRLWRVAADTFTRTKEEDVALKLGIANTLSLMGRIHFTAGSNEQSLEMCQKALQLRRSALGNGHVQVAVTLYNIGLVLRVQGQHDDALAHVQWFVHNDGINSDSMYAPHLAEVFHTLAAIHLDRRDLPNAIDSLKRCIHLREATHGPCHPALSDDLLSLGQILQDAGRYHEAMDGYRAALAIESALDTSEHPPRQESQGVATVLCSIGQVHQALGELREALQSYEEALRIVKANFGHQDEFVASMLGVIGNVHLEMGDTTEAVAIFAEAERIMQLQGEANGGNHLSRMVVPNLLQAIGIEFFPHAAAA